MVKVGCGSSCRLGLLSSSQLEPFFLGLEPARADLKIYEPARATPMARLEWLEPRPSRWITRMVPYLGIRRQGQ